MAAVVCRTCVNPAQFRVVWTDADGTGHVDPLLCGTCAASLAQRVGKVTLHALDGRHLRPVS